jgi:hypothetical protein
MISIATGFLGWTHEEYIFFFMFSCVRGKVRFTNEWDGPLEIDPETRFWTTFVVGSPLSPTRKL